MCISSLIGPMNSIYRLLKLDRMGGGIDKVKGLQGLVDCAEFDYCDEELCFSLIIRS